MITKTKEGFVLDIKGWGNIYMATKEGDIFYRHRDEDKYRLVIGIAVRRDIWNHLNSHSYRIRWREQNDEDITIPGFRPYQGELCLWYICESCGSSWPNSPDSCKTLLEKGCQYPPCPKSKRT